MKILSKQNHHTFHHYNIANQSPFISNKISTHIAKKISPQEIETSQNHKLIQNEGIKNYQNTELIRKINKKDYIITAPLKNSSQKSLYKPKNHDIKNYTTNDKKLQKSDNIVIERNSDTAPCRKRLKSESNKQNIINQQQKTLPTQQQNQQLNSISSLFHYSCKSKLAKLSNFMKYKNRPTMIFLSSKLPKDFFGDSIETPIKSHPKLLVHNRNSIEGNSIKKLKNSSSTKYLNNLCHKNQQNIQNINLNSKKESQFYLKNQNPEPAFTFRVGQNSSKKCSTKTAQPNKTENKHDITPYFEHKSQSTTTHLEDEHFPILKSNSIYNIKEPRRKLYKNFTKVNLKL